MARVKDLQHNPHNPRKITDSKLGQLKKALLEFGDLSGIVYNLTTQQLVGGHQRTKLFDVDADIVITKTYEKPTRTGTVAEGYVKLKGERFAYRQVKWDDMREKAANLAANKGAGEFDMETVAAWLKELDGFDVGIDLDLTMFDADEIKELAGITVKEHTRVSATGVDEDALPEGLIEPKTKLGDVYRLGNHRLMCGDSTDLKSVERLMKGVKADMVFTDPPYGVNYEGGTTKREKLKGDHDNEIYSLVLPVLSVFAEDTAAFYIWHAAGYADMAVKMGEAGFKIRNQIIWNKNNANFGALSAQYKQKHEPCFYAHKKKSAPKWYGPTNEVTVWDQNRESKNEYHPTQKPVELTERALTNSSAIGGSVLDLFGGSGSTLIACEKIDRKCFMMELDPHYCDVIVARWEKYTGRQAKLVSSAATRLKKPQPRRGDAGVENAR